MYTRVHMYEQSIPENALFTVHKLDHLSIGGRFSLRFYFINAKFRNDFPSLKRVFYIEKIIASTAQTKSTNDIHIM